MFGLFEIVLRRLVLVGGEFEGEERVLIVVSK